MLLTLSISLLLFYFGVRYIGFYCVFKIFYDLGITKSNKSELLSLFEAHVPSDSRSDVKLWVSRAKDIIDNPKKFNYNDWCWGDLANK